jgi:AcrR family transcriptional regulator
MSPRRYRMQARSQAVAETRSRIVQAATELHTEKGILATSWDEIADRAGVASATVYRHFPSLVELIPACARSVFEVVAQPTLEEVSAKFEHLSGPAERLEFFIRESCVCYAAGEGWLHAARRERDLIPAVGEAVRIQEQALEVLVRYVADGLGLAERSIAVLVTLCDFPFWKSLVDAGVERADVGDVIVELALYHLGAHAERS